MRVQTEVGGELLAVAQVLYAESTFNAADHRAQLHVARKRAARVGKDWQSVLLAYSSLARSDSPRARWIKSVLWWGDIEGESPRFNAGWRAIRELVSAFAADASSVEDPCVHATQWGARNLPSDHARATRAINAGRWVLARCSQRTANQYYAEIAR